MAVEVFEISNKYIFELRESHKSSDEVFDILPEFTLNTNEKSDDKTGRERFFEQYQPITARYFHQFVGSFEHEEPQKYLYFNLESIDHQLDYEMSQCGKEEFFKGFDFKKILSIFVPDTDEDIKNHVFPRTHYLIVELIYTREYDNYSGGWESEMDVDITGYLNANLEAVYFNK